MKLQDFNPILYLEDYENIPDDIYRWKQDEELHPAPGWGQRDGWGRRTGREGRAGWGGRTEWGRRAAEFCEGITDEPLMPSVLTASVPGRLCVGIGRYHTVSDGEIYLCTLLDRNVKTVLSCSFGVYRSPELVGKALDIFFQIYPLSNLVGEEENHQRKVSLLSSHNPIYLKKAYQDILAKYPVEPEMTPKGTRGGASVVSTYFSQLMRRKGSTVFITWQDAVDWLSKDIERYKIHVNMKLLL